MRPGRVPALLAAGLLALLCCLPGASRSGAPPRFSNSFEFVDALNAGVRVQRSFTRRRAGRRVGVSHVYWTNLTASTFHSHVEIQCIALDPFATMINSVRGRLDEKELGPLEPNRRERLELSLELRDAVMERMSCSVLDVG